MIFIKFLDDYQYVDNDCDRTFSLFSQRLKERRRMTEDELMMEPVKRFQQTYDLLERRFKHSSKSTNPIVSKIMKKIFHVE